MPEGLPAQLLLEAAGACAGCGHVGGYTVRLIDVATLSLRVSLVDGSFVDAFYNVANGKTSFALIDGRTRVFAKDNTYRSWHMHPCGNTDEHRPCPPCTLSEFLAEVEALRFPG